VEEEQRVCGGRGALSPSALAFNLTRTETKQNKTKTTIFLFTRTQEYIDFRAVEVLNAKPDKGVENALKQVCSWGRPPSLPPSLPSHLSLSSTSPSIKKKKTFNAPPLSQQGYRDDGALFLESDTDDQLLVNIPFTQAVRLTGLALAGPSAGAPGSDPDAAPKTVRLFVNRPSLGFAEAEADPSAQDIELSPGESTHPGAVIPLRAARFKGVTSLAVFIAANAGGADTTQVGSIKLSGAAGETFDVAAIKKQGEEGAA
jgi:hypothetical protein